MPQLPPEQVALPFAGAEHWFVQLPQCAGSVLVSTQAPLQSVRLQLATHCPALQVWEPQLRPQVPQFCGSLCVATHLPLQFV